VRRGIFSSIPASRTVFRAADPPAAARMQAAVSSAFQKGGTPRWARTIPERPERVTAATMPA